MDNRTVKLLAGDINWVHSLIYGNTKGLTEEELFKEPANTAPSIGWHVWHIMRWADMFQASFLGRSEIWKAQNLVSDFELDPSKLGPLQMGMELNNEEACAIPKAIGKTRLMDYTKSVIDACKQATSDLKDEDLYHSRKTIYKLDTSTKPATETEGEDVMTINDFLFHIGHASRHLGMIEALIGAVFSRSGTATI